MHFLHLVKNMKTRARTYFNSPKTNTYGFIFFSFKTIKKKLAKVFTSVIHFIKTTRLCNLLYTQIFFFSSCSEIIS